MTSTSPPGSASGSRSSVRAKALRPPAAARARRARQTPPRRRARAGSPATCTRSRRCCCPRWPRPSRPPRGCSSSSARCSCCPGSSRSPPWSSIPPLWLGRARVRRAWPAAPRANAAAAAARVGAVLEEALANTALVQTANAQAREQARLQREDEGASEAELGRHARRRPVRARDRPDRAGRRDPDHRARHVGAQLGRPDARRAARLPRVPLPALPPAARPLAPVHERVRGHGRRRARDGAARHAAARGRARRTRGN